MTLSELIAEGYEAVLRNYQPPPARNYDPAYAPDPIVSRDRQGREFFGDERWRLRLAGKL